MYPFMEEFMKYTKEIYIWMDPILETLIHSRYIINAVKKPYKNIAPNDVL